MSEAGMTTLEDKQREMRIRLFGTAEMSKFKKGDRVALTAEGWVGGVLSARLYTGHGTVTTVKRDPNLITVRPDRFDSIRPKTHIYHVKFWQLCREEVNRG